MYIYIYTCTYMRADMQTYRNIHACIECLFIIISWLDPTRLNFLTYVHDCVNSGYKLTYIWIEYISACMYMCVHRYNVTVSFVTQPSHIIRTILVYLSLNTVHKRNLTCTTARSTYRRSMALRSDGWAHSTVGCMHWKPRPCVFYLLCLVPNSVVHGDTHWKLVSSMSAENQVPW